MFLFLAFSSAVAQNVTETKVKEFHIGVVLDLGTTVGKVAHTSISIALEDFYAVHPNYTTRLVLHVRDSMSDDVQAASAVLDLLENYNVQAIIGPQKSSQAVFVSALGNKYRVPIISFTATSTSLSSRSLPYFVQATACDSAQVISIASIIKNYGWREVVLIYVDNNYGRGIIPDLVNVLEGIDAHIPYRSAIDESATSEQITQELYKLMTMQTRVFVVHMSSSLGSLFFTKAKEIGMMSKGFVWIITDGLANLIDSLNPSVVEAMNGVLGVESYVPMSTELDNFTMRWYMRSRNDHPNDPTLKLSIFGLWSYDTIWAVAQAAEKAEVTERKFQRPPALKNYSSSKTLENSRNGTAVLSAILQTKFDGLSGYFDLTDGQLHVSMFQIINVVGKAHRAIGFWSAQNGISQQSDQRRSNTTYWGTTHNLNIVIWPGESTEVPRGWEIPTKGKKLLVGIVTGGSYPKYIDANEDSLTGEIKASGLAIEIFEEAVKRLPYALPFEYVVFNTTENVSSSYDDFVNQVYLKKYDIAVGDITIRYNRSLYVDFTLPYTESGIAMVVPVKESVEKNAWIFLKPLTPGMWFGTIILFIYTGIVIWLLELLGNNKNVSGPIPRQLATMIYFSLFEEKEKVKRLTSRIVLVIWLFFLVVLKSSYTASLTSMLTVQQLQPTVTNVDELLKTGQPVGYGRGSYIKGLLEELGFDASKIKPYAPLGYFNALSKGSKNGGVAALVDEIPYIKLFLSEHCKGYTMVGPIYKNAGFGYALQKGSPLVGDISQAILNITGGDTIIQIEKKWIGDQNNCQNVGTISGTGRLTFDSFAGPIIATGVASTTSLVVAMIIYFCKNKQVRPENGDSEQILPTENGGDGECQCQQVARARGMHVQTNKVMVNGSLVIGRSERIHSLWVSSSARF
ncbi:unnamed protein product [Urochloa humidicola]